jgi:hypothetical protein
MIRFVTAPPEPTIQAVPPGIVPAPEHTPANGKPKPPRAAARKKGGDQ